MTFTTISRRKLLGTSAAEITAFSLAAGSSQASEVLPKSGCGHGGHHAEYAETLRRFVDSPLAAEEQKNMALRTANCPDCGVHIAAV